MTTVLIIGADSTVGTHLKKQFESHGKTVYGTTRHTDRCTNTTFFLDLLNPNAFTLPSDISIDTVVFCAAMSIIRECEENKLLSYQINVESPIKLACYLKNKFNPFIIFLSSNAVFDGSKPFFLEKDTPCPINYYGNCKAEAEKKLADITNKLAILRMTKILYPDHPLIKTWIHSLQNGENIYPFSDLLLAPISLTNVSDTIRKIAVLQKTGVFHLSGNQDISFAELAKKLAEKIKSSMQLIITSNSQQQSISHYNSLDMRSSKYYLGISEINIKTIIDEIWYFYSLFT